MEFTVIHGDIAEQSADALVNETDTGLGVSGGISVALWQEAGRDLVDAAIEQAPIGLGQVVVTEAFDLDADYVVHAAVMPDYGDRKATAESIERAAENALEAADERDCTSLIIPALGCGVGGFDLEDGTRIILSCICAYDADALEDVRFIAYEDDEYEQAQDVAEQVRADDR